jgi:hypothetical protein
VNSLNPRHYWLQTLQKLCAPVLEAAVQRRLRAALPAREGECDVCAPLSAISRVLASIAPWLELEGLGGEEAELQKRFRILARAALASVLDPDSPDYVPVSSAYQTLVEAAKLSQSILYAPHQLWAQLDARAQSNLIAYLTTAREIRPSFNNWLLFAAVNEVTLRSLGQPWDKMRVDYALRQHQQWYLGDGVYGDGPEYHFDYYNSLVIHPLLITVIKSVAQEDGQWAALEEPILKRARRYSQSLERLISPEGTYPPIGRSLGYRCGVFHSLAHLALIRELPSELPASQVRAALTAVMHRSLDVPETFDENGWLQIGFCGAQPSIAESYLTVSTSYLCGFVLLPLGLSSEDDFWSQPDLPWTARRLWGGEEVKLDKAMAGRN